MPTLAKTPTTPPKEFTKKGCQKDLKTLQGKLFDLQNTFYVDGRFGLLVIFQGVDTSGKDGTIRHVMSCMNPMGVDVKAFKKPTEEEATHDFLWRVYPHIPAHGQIEVFNRSYYEDIIVPMITNTISDKQLAHRFQFINELEQHLGLSNIHVLKFFLHISGREQKERIEERKTLPRKMWKYDKLDEEAAMELTEYLKIYDQVIAKCDVKKWHIIPSDKRWYRNYEVARILTKTLEDLELKYPEPKKK